MPQQFAMRYTVKGGATSYEVYRNNNGSLTALGLPELHATYGAAVPDNNQSGGQANFVVQFGGRVFARMGQYILRYNPATNRFTIGTGAIDLGPSSTIQRAGGFFVGRGPTGAPRLLHPYGNNTALYAAYLDDPEGNWTAQNLSTVINNGGYLSKGIVVNNTVHFAATGGVFAINIASLGTIAQAVGAAQSYSVSAFCRTPTRLYMLNCNQSASAEANIREFIGGSWVTVYDSATGDRDLPKFSGAQAPSASTPWTEMFYDEASDSLIIMGWQEGAAAVGVNPGGSGIYMVRKPLDNGNFGIAGTDISSLWGALGAPGGTDPNADARFSIEVDTDTDPTAPVTYIWICGNNGVWSRFRWNGISTPLTPLGTGGDRGYALTHNPSGGGQYTYDGSTTANPAYHIEEVQARVPIVGGTRIFLRGYIFDETGGSPTPTDETVGLYWGTTQSQPDNLATISNAQKVSGTGTAPGITANKITNFTFDGSTIYSVDWAAVSDGVANQQVHMLMPHVEI